MTNKSEKRYLNKCVENLRFLLERASLPSSINMHDLRTRNQKTGTEIICCLQRTTKAAKNMACSVVLRVFFFSVMLQKATLVPGVFLDFSSRMRSSASREAATTSGESDEEREKNLWLPWPRISLSCRRQLSNASNC